MKVIPRRIHDNLYQSALLHSRQTGPEKASTVLCQHILMDSSVLTNQVSLEIVYIIDLYVVVITV